MSIEDLRDHTKDADVVADVCVVGAGPAGIAVALELAGHGHQVCLVESGGASPDPTVDPLGEIESVGLRRLPHTNTRARGLGGTTARWTGRCGVLDGIDYAARPWVDHSGWPIDHRAIEPFLERAGAVLGLGPARYGGADVDALVGHEARHWDLARLGTLGYQFSRHTGELPPAPVAAADAPDGVVDPLEALHHAGAPQAMHVGTANAAALAAALTLRVITHAHVTEVVLEPTGTAVAGVEIAALTGRRGRVRARRVVLCCGGVDNARLLLASRSIAPQGVGNDHDLVGRYLMDHPYTVVASYPRGAGRALRRRLGHRWVDLGGTRYVYSSGLRLSPELQRREGLLNASAYLVERGQRGAPLRQLVEALSGGEDGQDGRAGSLSEAATVLRRPDRLALNAYERLVLRRPSLADPDLVEIDTVVEQMPDPASRITLSEERDALGMPRAVIDWRAADLEFDTTVRMAALLEAEIARLGYERPDRSELLDAGPDEWRARTFDSSHPMGATRMSASPRTGVVDPDCQVHGVEGLFVASGSVFPTSGHINPTLTIVSLAIRLADHLDARLRIPAAPIAAPRRTRVGLVGAGERITSVYLPILQALADRYEVVGFTSRSSASRERFAAATALTDHRSADALVRETSPDLLVVAVSPDVVDGAVPPLIELGVPLLLETPFAWDVRAGRRTLDRIAEKELTVGVAEQTPFLPLEQLKRTVIDLGMLGVVSSAHNDFACFDYHGAAALRAYLGGGRWPVLVSAVSAGGEDPDALLGTIVCSDGSVLRQDVGRSGGVRDADWAPALRVQGSLGSIAGDRLVRSGADGASASTTVERKVRDGCLIQLRLVVGDEEVCWRNPFADHRFTDEQIAVATLVDSMVRAVRTGGDPAYRCADALVDNDIRTAMRYSARRAGAPVRLPLRPALERLRTVDVRAAVGQITAKARTRRAQVGAP